MKISEVYTKYKINQGLQQHMLRVAAVAQMVSENIDGDTDTQNIVTASLLHDMGNIIKTKFNIAPELFQPEGVEYWQQVQKEVMERYGDNEHTATDAMVKEITDNAEVFRIVDDIEFAHIVDIAECNDRSLKIAQYADMRVGMHGIVTLDERFDDIDRRYAGGHFSQSESDARRAAAKQIERKLFSQMDLNPEDVNDISTQKAQHDLLQWEV